MNGAAMFAAWNIIRTGNVLGIRHDEFDDKMPKKHKLKVGTISDTGPVQEKEMLGSTNKEEVERRDELPEHVKTAKRVRAATSNIAGLSVQAQLAEQRIETLFERLDRVEKLYMTLLQKMEQFEQQYVTSLRSMVGGGPTVRS
jgi:archaellum component FlaC